MKNLYKIEDELYIISNTENVDENCWIITDGKLVQVSYLLSDEVAKGNKVIITTNKLLINDDVQEIDDEFLEWFVKNPTCEFVHVYNDRVVGYEYDRYTILIPQEEPNQETIEEKLDKIVSKEPSKFWEESDKRFKIKETLEEAAEKCFKEKELLGYTYEVKDGFILGAKWQAERIGLMEIELNHTKRLLASCEKALEERDKQIEESHSEEDLREAFRQGQENIDYSEMYGLDSKLTEQEWFEQFKKK